MRVIFPPEERPKRVQRTPEKIHNYQCFDCGDTIMTRQIVPGLPPYWLRCDSCGGTRRPVGKRPLFVTTPTHEWYAPMTGRLVFMYDPDKTIANNRLLKLRRLEHIPLPTK